MSFTLPDVEILESVQAMLSEDAPIFSDDLPPSHEYIFNAMEDLPSPEAYSVDRLTIQANWLCTDMYELVAEAGRILEMLGAKAITAYYWADEEQGFMRYNAGLSFVDGWRTILIDGNVKTNIANHRWLKKAFKVLSTQR